MSAPFFAWAWRQDLAPSPRVVLCVLAAGADTQGQCSPTVNEIAALSRVSRRAARDALDLLERRGFIVKSGKNGAKTTYSLSMHLAKPGQNPPRSKAKNGHATGADLAHDRGGFATGAKSAPLDSHAPAGEVPDSSLTEYSSSESPPVRPPPLAPPAAQDAAASRAAHRANASIPGDWEPDGKGRALALGLGLDPDAEAAEFRDHWLSVGTRRKDWDAAFRNRCRAQVRYYARQAAKPDRRQGELDRAIADKLRLAQEDEPRSARDINAGILAVRH